MHIRSISKHLYALVVMIGLAMAILPVNNAMAMYYHPWVRDSHVKSEVTKTGSTWNYAFTVYNDSYEDGEKQPDGSQPMPVIVTWDLPFFGDAGITGVYSPDGWAYTFETIGTPNPSVGWDGIISWQNPSDPMYQGPTSPFTTVTNVLHWYITPYIDNFNTMIWSGEEDVPQNAIYPVFNPSVGQTERDGFGFIAGYGKIDAPYQSTWVGLSHWTGDPANPEGNGLGLPSSPDTLGTASVPEPTTMLLLGLGLMGVLGIRRKIQK